MALKQSERDRLAFLRAERVRILDDLAEPRRLDLILPPEKVKARVGAREKDARKRIARLDAHIAKLEDEMPKGPRGETRQADPTGCSQPGLKTVTADGRLDGRGSSGRRTDRHGS